MRTASRASAHRSSSTIVHRSDIAFTRTEWVIIVVIIAVLAAIAVPNFFQAPIPGISRASAYMRSLATGLESYFIDHKAYPPMHPLRDFVSRRRALTKAGGWNLMTIEPGGQGRAGLTTPLAYVERLYPDPASPGGQLPAAYFTDGTRWMLYSAGPDRKYQIDPPNDLDGATSRPSVQLVNKTYDPTNGYRSAGDIWRSGPY